MVTAERQVFWQVDIPDIKIVARMPAAWRLMVLQKLAQWGVREETLLLLMAVAIGLAGGTAAWVFKWLVEFLTTWIYETPAHAWHATQQPYIFLLPLIPATGGLLMSFIRWLFRTKPGPSHGLSNVLVALVRNGGKIPHKTALETLLTSSLTIGSGGSAGPEAPIAIIGSSLGSSLGTLAGISRRNLPTLVGCGAAAGIGAVFDAPIAGVLFVLEVMLRDFSIRTFTPIVISAVVATTMFHSIVAADSAKAVHGLFEMTGNSGAFTFTFKELPYYVLLGVVSAIAAVALVRAMNFVERSQDKLKVIPPFFRPALGAFCSGLCGVGIILLFWHDPLVQSRFAAQAYVPVFGGGYLTILRAIDPSWYVQNGHFVGQQAVYLTLTFLTMVAVFKIIATALTLGSGGSGGVFAPALLIGATAGGAFGLFLSQFTPEAIPSAYALVAMGAVLAAVIQAPLMAILLVFEITRNYQVMLPMMLAVVVATLLYRLSVGESVYTQPLKSKGVRLGSATGISALRRITLDQLQLQKPSTLSVNETLSTVLQRSHDQGVTEFVVLNQKNDYLGMLTLEDLYHVMHDPEAAPLLLVGEVCRTNIKPLQKTDTLEQAMELFAQNDINHVAIFDRSGGKPSLAGVLTRTEVMKWYHGEMGT